MLPRNVLVHRVNHGLASYFSAGYEATAKSSKGVAGARMLVTMVTDGKRTAKYA